MKKLLAILMLGFFVVGCSAHTGTVTSRDLTTLGGCAVGGIAGSKIGSGSGKTTAIIVGTALGCAAGDGIGKKYEYNQ